MTRPADHVEVVCSRCGTVFTTYLERHTDHEPDGPTTECGACEPAACPECGTVAQAKDSLMMIPYGGISEGEGRA
jgi:hypothetical protein